MSRIGLVESIIPLSHPCVVHPLKQVKTGRTHPSWSPASLRSSANPLPSRICSNVIASHGIVVISITGMGHRRCPPSNACNIEGLQHHGDPTTSSSLSVIAPIAAPLGALVVPMCCSIMWPTTTSLLADCSIHHGQSKHPRSAMTPSQHRRMLVVARASPVPTSLHVVQPIASLSDVNHITDMHRA